MVDFKHTKNQDFYDYWLSLPREGILPHRRSFLPEAVPSLLPSMMIYELISEDFIKIRLLGTSAEVRYGQNSTGGNYLDLVEADRRSKASQALWSQAKMPCGMHTFLEQDLQSGRTAYLEAVGLPVLHDQDDTPLLLFQCNEIVNDNKVPWQDQGAIKTVRVAERSYFDLGAGVSDFRD